MGYRKEQIETPQKWAVIGGGILGMTTAMRLAEAGHNVTLIESADHLGGMADAWKLGNITWDRHYHVTLLSDSYTREILRTLGLDDDMQWVETRTGFFTNGRLHSMSNSLEFLKFPPLSLLSKFRLGLTIFAGSRITDWRKLEGMHVETWLRKWSGERTWQKIWRPLLRSKLGENYRITSAAFIWATIQRLYAARRTGLKKEMFGYLPGGYSRMLNSFSAQLESLGIRTLLGEKVTAVTKENNAIQIESDSGTLGAFDRAVMTIPSRLISQIVPQLSHGERQLHEAVQYQGIVCVSLLLDRPLADFYVTNITDEVVPFTGVIEMSTLVDRKEFGGKSLVYLPFYVPENDPLFDQSDESIRETSLSGLETMYPNFRREHVVDFRVSRVRRVMPIPTLNYSKSVPSMETGIPGLYAVNSVQIVNGTLNVNETVKLAETATAELLLRDSATNDKPTIEAENHVAAC